MRLCRDVRTHGLLKIFYNLNKSKPYSQDNERKKYGKDYMLLDPPDKKKFDENYMKCVVTCYNDHTDSLAKLKERMEYFIKRKL